MLVGHAPNCYLVLYKTLSNDESASTIGGTLFVTNHRLAFVPPSPFSIDPVSIAVLTCIHYTSTCTCVHYTCTVSVRTIYC